MSANEILPGLWLGNARDSQNPSFLKMIDVIINCTKDLPFVDDSKHCVRVSVDDNLEKAEIVALYKYLDKVTQFIHENLKEGKSILVHCMAGKQRSASVVTAYLSRFCHFSLSDAIELLRSKRIIVFTPLCNFEAALRLFCSDRKKDS